MLKKILMVTALTGAWVLSVGYTLATDQEHDQAMIYGNQLMTAQERTEYRSRMRASITDQQREKIRNEHHKLMAERAAQRGVTLPDVTPPKGSLISASEDKGPGNGH